MTIFKLGVVGQPIKHSLSPIIHQEFSIRTGIQLQYEAYEVPPEALDSLGWVCYRLGDHAEAIKHLTRALSSLLIPEPEIVAHLGEVLWITGQKKEARLVWGQILQNDPSNAIIQETLERLEVE